MVRLADDWWNCGNTVGIVRSAIGHAPILFFIFPSNFFSNRLLVCRNKVAANLAHLLCSVLDHLTLLFYPFLQCSSSCDLWLPYMNYGQGCNIYEYLREMEVDFTDTRT